jgi:hypothetical protein
VAPILGARLRARLVVDAVRFCLWRPYRIAIRSEYGSFTNFAVYIRRKFGWFGTRAEYRAFQAELAEEAA